MFSQAVYMHAHVIDCIVSFRRKHLLHKERLRRRLRLENGKSSVASHAGSASKITASVSLCHPGDMSAAVIRCKRKAFHDSSSRFKRLRQNTIVNLSSSSDEAVEKAGSHFCSLPRHFKLTPLEFIFRKSPLCLQICYHDESTLFPSPPISRSLLQASGSRVYLTGSVLKMQQQQKQRK